MTPDIHEAARQAAREEMARQYDEAGLDADTADLIRAGKFDSNVMVAAAILGAEAAAAAVLPMVRAENERWRPMADAKKDGTPILVKIRDDLLEIRPGRDDLRYFAGIQAVMQHRGLADDGFDIGWQFAAPVGCGGFPDDWLVGWKPLSVQPAQEDTAR